MRTQEVFIRSDGTILTIGDAPPELAALGEGTRRRATSIVPLHRRKRFVFLFLRLLFGERGRIAEYTRSWYGPWYCRLYATGEEYVHQSRRCCLEWEHRKLNDILSEG